MTSKPKVEKVKKTVEESQPDNLKTVSQLEFLTRVDRATIRKRLNEAGITPDPASNSRRLLYPWSDELKSIIIARVPKDNKHEALKADKTAVEVELKVLQLQEKRGDLVPFREVVEETTALWSATHRKFLQWARAFCQRHKLGADIETAMREDVAGMFNLLGNDYERFMQDGEK